MLVRRILMSLALVLFAGAAFVSGMDRLSGKAVALSRLVPQSLQAEGARSVARLALSKQNAEGALAAASRAVMHDPVHPESTALMATAYLLGGKNEQADEAYRVAALFGWRETATQVYWMQVALQAGDYGVAVDRADAIMRAHPTFVNRDQILQQIEDIPEARAILVQHLANRPDWIETYFAGGSNQGDDLLARRAIVAEALGRSDKAMCGEITDFTRRLLERGMRDSAQAVWTANCPTTGAVGTLDDPEFDALRGRSGSPFGWTVLRSGDVAVVPRETSGGDTVLRLSNSASVSRKILQQAVSLKPGSYRLKAKVVDSGQSQQRAIFASLDCGSGAKASRPIDVKIDGSGQLLSIGQCDTQTLTLWLQPGVTELDLTAVLLEPAGS